jgi:hypothetical protein
LSKRIVAATSLALLLVGILGLEFIVKPVGAMGSIDRSIGLSGEQALINPVPGQYANYSIKYYENETMAFSGWWNFSYLEYVEPNLINVTLDYDVAETDGEVRYWHDIGWLTIDITNRWVVETASGVGMGGTWYDFWIETNVTEGSVIRIERGNGTVVKSEAIKFATGFVDCWVVNSTTERASDSLTFLYDKKTGLCTMAYASTDRSEYGGLVFGACLTLVSTNIPIGAYSPMHELGISLEAPTTLRPNESALVIVTVHNYGLSNETDVEIQLLVDGTIVNSTVVPFIENGSFAELTHVWTPPDAGAYNITAYVKPVPGEALLENNRITVRSRVRYEAKIGVRAGDWIIYNYTVIGAPSGAVLPQWMKIEFLSVEGTRASVLATMRMSDGTEQNQTMNVDIVAGGGTLGTISGIVIAANLTVGDSFYMSGYGDVVIESEQMRTYAGARRTVLGASLIQGGNKLEYYWDKQTGIMVESAASYPQLNITATAKAYQTNMWQASTIIYLSPSEANVRVGETYTVNVTIANVTNLYTWQIQLSFDPTVLNCTNARYTENHVFAGKEIVAVNPVINNTEGYVLYGCCLLGNEETFNGNGTLCQIQFTAMSSGKSALGFSGPEDTFLLDFGLNEVPYGTRDGCVTVEEGLHCDLNNDRKVDIADLSLAAKAFGSYSTYPRWNPTADINGDGTVNIVDLVLIVKRFA